MDAQKNRLQKTVLLVSITYTVMENLELHPLI